MRLGKRLAQGIVVVNQAVPSHLLQSQVLGAAPGGSDGISGFFSAAQAFEYQCTHEVGKEGAGYISTAIALGTIKHPALALAENSWYTSVPTVLPNTTVENNMINEYADLSTKYNMAKGGQNLFIDQIVNGYAVEGMGSAEESAAYVAESLGGMQYLFLKQEAWTRLQDYYAALAQ